VLAQWIENTFTFDKNAAKSGLHTVEAARPNSAVALHRMTMIWE